MAKTKLLILALFVVNLYSYTAFEKATSTLVVHEGFRSKMYIDNGNYSIGYGTNLSEGISREEAMLLLAHRLKRIERQLLTQSWYTELSIKRKAALLDLCYQVGFTRLLKFRHFIWRLENKYYKAAGNALKDSKWYKEQTGRRRSSYIIKAITIN
jgi:lysozyme